MSNIIESERNVKTNNCNSDTQSTSSRQLDVLELSGIYAVYAIVILIAVVSAIILRAKHPKDLEVTKTVNRRISSATMSVSNYLGIIDDGDEDEETSGTTKNEECDNLSPHEKMLQKLVIDLHSELKAELMKELDDKSNESKQPEE